jgi:hypothetical protein
MDEYKVGDLALMLGALTAARRDLSTSDNLQKPICTDQFCANLSVVLEGLVIVSENFEADPSLIEQIQTLGQGLKTGKADRREAVLCARLDAIGEAISNNLNSRKFMFIPEDDAAYWNNEDLFGKNFLDTFPKPALLEMMEVGRCFAAGRGTACVFHCMRVAEYGLRNLAQKLHVRVIHKGKGYPIDYAEWDKIIDGIKAKLPSIRSRQRGVRRERSLQFYSSAADHCEFMKDIWRNEVAHARRMYNKSETLAVVNRVRDFIMLFEAGEKDALTQARGRIQKLQRAIKGVVENSTQRDQDRVGDGEAPKSKKAEA